MPRLVPWPVGVIPKKASPVSGPRSVKASSTTSITGFVQTVSSPFGLWRWQFVFDRMMKQKARRYRGLLTSLHGGANAVRVSWVDGAPLLLPEWGTSITQSQANVGMLWSNGKPWSNGMNWKISPPGVPISAATSRYDDIVALSNVFWRTNLGVGDVIGFTPFHFGWYEITEVISGGKFRVWPPLRKDISTANSATLNPVMVMRMEGEPSGTFDMEVGSTSESTLTMIEVEDSDARTFYTG